MILLENNWGKVRCPYCDSVISDIEKKDINTNYDGEIYIICPVCDSFIWTTHNTVIKRILAGITWHK